MASTIELSKKAITALNMRTLEYSASHYSEYEENVSIDGEDVNNLFDRYWYGEKIEGDLNLLEQKMLLGTTLCFTFIFRDELHSYRSYKRTLIFKKDGKNKNNWFLWGLG